jgi:YggT family protein
MFTSLQAAGIFLIQSIFNAYLYIILLRIVLQYSGISYYNPLAQLCVRLTDKPMHLFYFLRKVPTKIDLAALAWFFVVQLLYFIAILLLAGVSIPAAIFPTLLLFLLKNSISCLLNLYFYSLLMMVILSWVSPPGGSPIYEAFFKITEPLLRWIRKVIPPIAGFDLSPVVAMLLIQAIQIAGEGLLGKMFS